MLRPAGSAGKIVHETTAPPLDVGVNGVIGASFDSDSEVEL
jgi:hypothetical protein